MAQAAWTPWSCGNLRLPGGRRLTQKQTGHVCTSAWVQSLLVLRQKGKVRVQRYLHSLQCDREDSLQGARLRDATVGIKLNCQLELESGRNEKLANASHNGLGSQAAQ